MKQDLLIQKLNDKKQKMEAQERSHKERQLTTRKGQRPQNEINGAILDSRLLVSRIVRKLISAIKANDTTLTAENKEELKSLLMKVRMENKNAGLKLNIQKTKIMKASPIT